MYGISDSEWEVMRVIWAQGPVKSSAIIAVLEKKCNWTPSTIKTLLGRLVEKNYVHSSRSGRAYLYQALIDQNSFQKEMVKECLNKICSRQVGSVLLSLLEDLPMTQKDILAFQKLLAKKEKSATETIPCSCSPGQCQCRAIK
ncbi:CopY/TcrY family copper transport repressor [Streptococcus didelphis]|uniref:CopY/TcrY family copper transport repressor n=1 Tax=Streptococcus didelphis TaxID=102886 RepID=UPI00036A96F3|nr:CopY/TcrY family copper transport repressor [Streptococcus didelphis]